MLTFRIEGLGELEREWKGPGLGAIVDGCVRGIEKAMDEASTQAKHQHRWKSRTGTLERSIAGRIVSLAIGSAGGEVEGELAAGEDYASFLEEGTKAHEIRPKAGRGAMGPLAEGQSRGRKKKGTPVLRWQGADGTWHSAKVVHHPGTKSDPFMGPALQKAERVIVREIEVGEDASAAIMNRG